MIKKIISILFAILIFSSMTVVAMAESLQITTDKDTVSAGELISINVVFDETITGEYRNIQGQLNYNTDLLTYVSHQSGEQYNNYTCSDMADRGYFTFSYTDFTDDGFSEIAEGNVVSVKFKVKENLTTDHIKTALDLDANIQDIKGNTEELTVSTSVLICEKHEVVSSDTVKEVNEDEDVINDKKDKTVCEKCGEEYSVDEIIATGTTHDDSSNIGGLAIGVIITVLAATGVLLVYRKKYK